MNLKAWLGGIISAACGGATGAFGTVMIDPEHFNFSHFGMLLKIAAVCAVVPVLAFLARSPLPGMGNGTKTENPPGKST